MSQYKIFNILEYKHCDSIVAFCIVVVPGHPKQRLGSLVVATVHRKQKSCPKELSVKDADK